MTWATPTLSEVRRIVRDYIAAGLPGADAAVPNSVLRVMADSNAALAHLTLLYLDWLSKQIMIDTAEAEWLDRFGNIWVNGRKAATFATGTATFTGDIGTVIPDGTVLQSSAGVQYQTTEEITLGAGPTSVELVALDPGSSGNQVGGASLSPQSAISGVESNAVVVSISGGLSIESDDSLRSRILDRIRQPPHGGSANDYVQWARDVPGVTRAWAKMEAGLGTVTVRFMMDDDRAPYGLPLEDDIEAVREYIDERRPVSVRDVYIISPTPRFITVAIGNLSRSDASVRAAIEVSLKKMFLRKASPGGTMYRSWIGDAVSSAAREDHHELVYQTTHMRTPGELPILKSIIYR